MDIIGKKIRKLTASADISDVMGEVEALLDRSVAPEGYVIEEKEHEWETEKLVDLSEIDFEALRERFATKHKRIEAEKLRVAIKGKTNATGSRQSYPNGLSGEIRGDDRGLQRWQNQRRSAF